MKRFLLIGVFLLAACGGGGGGGATPPTTSNPPPPQPTPTPIANTSLSMYLPLSNGNSWTFATGAKMIDMGSYTLTCTCPGNGSNMERIGLYPAGSQTVSGSFFFTKNTPQGGTQITNVVGVENDSDTNNITIASSAQYPYGIPVMDDNPQVNESWNDGGGDVSTIISVGGTMMLPNNTEVIDIATDQDTGNFNAITWGFAKGVGFTSLAVGNQSTALASFYVNTTTSYARKRQTGGTAVGHIGTPDIRAALQKLF